MSIAEPEIEPAPRAIASLPVGATIVLAFRVFARSPGKLIGLLLLEILVGSILTILQAFTRGQAWAQAAGFGIEVVDIAVQMIIGGAIVFATAEVMARGTFDFEEALGVGLRRSFVVLGVTILQFVVTAAAMLLLVVPGVIVSLMLSVAVPACVIETLGPIGGLGRSRALTRGNRWRIFAIGLVIIAIAAPVLAVITVCVVAHLLFVAVPLALAAIVAFGILALTLPMVLFVQLRMIEAGAGPGSVPAVRA